MNRRFFLLFAAVIVAASAGPGISRAQQGHNDVLTLQENGQLVTGESVCNDASCTTQQSFLGVRFYANEFPEQFFVTKPGFASPGTGSAAIPAPAQALPANTALSWDFLPMTIGSLSSNLFYWNGQDTDGVPGITAADVAFGTLPGPNYTLSLFDQANVAHAVNGTNTFVAGGSVGKTDSLGHIHQHRTFFLEDGDGNSSTSPADGIYLLAMHMRVSGIANSLPMFLLFGTEGSSVDALDNASVPWVESQLDLPGDYNGDGIVNAADYTLWRDTLGETTTSGLFADGSGNGTIDQPDFDVWKQHFGTSSQLLVNVSAGAGSGGIASASVPEPPTGWLVLTATAVLTVTCVVRKRRSDRIFSDNKLRSGPSIIL